MRLADFDYPLPKELIAQYPLKERPQARLLILDRKKGVIEHAIFKDIGGYLAEDDLLVLNNTRVLPSRILGARPSGGKVELLLLKEKPGLVFEALIRPARVKLGEKISFNGAKISATVSARNEITFAAENRESIYRLGVMPLPPYIKRQSEEADNRDYQTVYASQDGSIAAPTAGLHFTPELIKEIQAKGTEISYITLHINYSTFKPVKVEDITRHKMDKEYFEISFQAQKQIEAARTRQGRIFAVGTTSCRVLESYAAGKSTGYTDLFIYPGYNFKLTDCLMTNFHMPRTTLFMLVCAFAGEKLIKQAYQQAIDKKYRFLSYGDAMLIL